MGKYGRARQRKSYKFVDGGLVTLPDDTHIEAMGKGKLYATQAVNVDFFKRGSAQKSRGWTAKGLRVNGGSAYSTNGIGNDTSFTVEYTAHPNTQTIGLAYPLTAPATRNIASLEFKVRPDNALGTLYFRIRADSSGSPGAVITNGESAGLAVSGPGLPGGYVSLGFSNPPTLTSGTTYWLCCELVVSRRSLGSSPAYLTAYGLGVGTPGTNLKRYNGTSWSSEGTGSQLYWTLLATTPPILGLWDTRIFDSANTALTQFYGSACDGNLYAGDPDTVDPGGSWDDPIHTGLASLASQLYDMKIFKNYAFFTDYAQHDNRVWDGFDATARSAPDYPPGPLANRNLSTMKHGPRPEFTGADGGPTGGTQVWASTGYVSVMAVTDLKSGGKRSYAVEVPIAGTNSDIDIASIENSDGQTEFYFDIDPTATTWYITEPYATAGSPGIYYKCPVNANYGIPVATANPSANGTTNFTIQPMTSATIRAGGDIEKLTGLPQGYFTLQVDTPKFKGLEVFANMLCGWGDPDYPSRVWVSEQGAPQVFGTYGSTLGNYIDVAPEDGELVTGVKAVGQVLFVTKQHSVYRVDFTGDINDPFRVEETKGFIGALSHWGLEIIPEGLYFLSELGPAVCYGTYSRLLPATQNIRNLFDRGYAERFNQEGLALAVSCNDPSRGVIYTTVSSTDSEIRDQALVYDYSGQQFSLMADFNASVMGTIGDENSFPSVWYGDYQGQAYQQNSDAEATTNGLSIMPMKLYTPFLELGDGSQRKSSSFVWLYADVPDADVGSSVVVYVDVMIDGSDTVVQTLTYPFTTTSEAAQMRKGVARPIAPIFRSIKLGIRTSSPKPLTISGLDIDFTPEGQDL